MAQNLINLAILVGLVLAVWWVVRMMCVGIWMILDDTARVNGWLPKEVPEPRPTMMCDGCGSGPWHWQWDPDHKTRKSRKFYCPNCTGAD